MEYFFQTYSVGIAASVVLILVMYAILDYSGLFYTIVVKQEQNPVGRLRVAYLYNTGPYKNCGPLFARVASLAPHHRCIGIYYDDPKTTNESEYRYIVGSILSEGDETVDEEMLDLLRENGFRVAEFPAIESALTADFPFPWMLSLLFAIWRVYPKLRKAKESGMNAHPAIEIYDGPKIRFYMPASNHDAYFVPEATSEKLKSA